MPRDGERSLRAAQQGGEIDRLGTRNQRIDQIAAHAAGDIGKGMRDVLRLAPAEGEQVAEEGKRLLLPLGLDVPLPTKGRGTGWH